MTPEDLLMDTRPRYEALMVETLADRLDSLPALVERVGHDSATWQIQEVGDGNLNLVFIVSGPKGAVIVKQALPYVRLVGDSWPLPLSRAYFEYNALTRQADRAPGAVPEVYYFDKTQALIVMEFLEPHVILRQKLIAGERVAGLSQFLGTFCARTAFRGSELCMKSPDKKADVALFAGNVDVPAITEALVFTDPYFEAELNSHTPGLEPVIAKLRGDVTLKTRAQLALQRFMSNTETKLHGDLHTGSIMSTDSESRVIDPEFVQYGPMGFDIGMLCANFLMAYFSQPAHRADDLEDYQQWILSVTSDLCETFNAEFRTLWATERTGALFPAALFEDQDHASDVACNAVLAGIWRDAWTACGIEMHRRCLSLAHNADFEEIEDVALRAKLEARNLMMGADLIHRAELFESVADVVALAQDFNRKDIL